jgi:membrane fusion protein (multidrug efflux system)
MAEDTPQPTEHEDAAENPSPRRSPRTRIILIIVALVAIVAGAIWFIRYETHGKYIESTNDAYVQADAVTVAPKVGGYVAELFVTDNQTVKAGQPLLRIDPRDYQAQTAQYQAQIDVSKANAEGVQAQIREQQATVDQSRAQLAAAQSAYQFAHNQVVRYAPLGVSGAETGEKIAQLRDNETQARAQVAQAQAALTSAQRRIGTLTAQVKQALSQGESAQAQLAAADVNLGATTVRASINGRIGDKSVQLGQFVQPGVRLMSVVPVDKLYITANFKETQLGLMRPGQPVSLKIDALSGVQITGHVESFAPGTGAQFSLIPPQNATGNFTKIVQRVPVRIVIDAGPETRKLLLPGMSVDVDVDTISAKGERDQIKREQATFNRKQGQ